MSKLNMFEGICGSRAETLSKVLDRVYLIFNFSPDDSDPELGPQRSGSGTLTEHKCYSRHFVLSKIRGHAFIIRNLATESSYASFSSFDYLEAGQIMTRMAGRVGPGVNVIPLLPILVGGIGSETLLRDMMDLDCWIVSTGAGQATGLPDSRDALWRVVCEEGMGERRVYTSSAPLSLPGGIKNPRIRPFMSGAYAGTIPAEILPLEPEAERALVGTLLQELNEKFCVNLDPNPSLDRSIPPPPTVHNTGRTVFIGGVQSG
jgi:hypothetical protein